MLLLAGASFFTKAEVHVCVSRKHKVSWADTEGKPGKNVFDTMYATISPAMESIDVAITGI
jgi:hypothetical protein